MVNNVITADRKSSAKKEKQCLDLELAEIREISDMMFKKLELKIQTMQALEASIDKKQRSLELLIQQADLLEKKIQEGGDISVSLEAKRSNFERLLQNAEKHSSQECRTNRNHEIIALAGKGLAPREIAEVLVMPQGEVELILELNLQKA